MAYIPSDARWYLVDVVLEHTIGADPRNVVHINTHLIGAQSPEQAYEKSFALGKSCEQVYKNTDGQDVKIVFRGLQDLNVIHDELEDGAELAFCERVAVEKKDVDAMLSEKENLGVFRAGSGNRDVPNYMPQSVMRAMNDAGIFPDDPGSKA
jgi:hypothetical protein